MGQVKRLHLSEIGENSLAQLFLLRLLKWIIRRNLLSLGMIPSGSVDRCA